MEQHQFSIPMDPFFPTASITPIFSLSSTTTQQPLNHHPPHPTSTPTPIPAPAQHPPYEEMITTAIAALNESEGSSKQAISKYIDRVFKNLPSNHSELLTHHMKMLKNSGQIVLLRRSYMLPPRSASAPPPFIAPPPPNATTNGGSVASTVTYSNSGTSAAQNFQNDYMNYYDGSVGLHQDAVQASAPVAQSIGHAFPGVPNNVVPTAQGNGGISGSEAMLVSLGLSDGASVEITQTKKRRGRPPKSTSAAPGLGQGVPEPVAQSGPNEPSVAPPASGVLPVQVPVEAPVPAPASSTGRPRGRPKRFAVEAAVTVPAPNSGNQQPKKRGRKPKNAEQVIHSAVPVTMVMPNPGIVSGAATIPPQYTVGAPNSVGSLPPVGEPQLPSGKRRGRPPLGRMLKKHIKATGNWPGRPKKVINVSTFTLLFLSFLSYIIYECMYTFWS
ncbi:hypothetical protein LIER_21693 [Lithospermum erythrorhizon]|uniref:H15 domain-containing protein n=1 Tax=Lithospermum erythrorhizon TaxID=34254 RepID=A0AAV3QR41_LITER